MNPPAAGRAWSAAGIIPRSRMIEDDDMRKTIITAALAAGRDGERRSRQSQLPGFRCAGLLHNRRNGLSRAERADYGCHGP